MCVAYQGGSKSLSELLKEVYRIGEKMMNVRELVKQANKRDKLMELLEGKGEYKYEVSEFIGANVPTDWARIIDSGIYEEYRINKDESLKEKMENAICKMCQGNEFEIYCATMVVFFQIMSEKRNEAPFNISLQLTPILKQALQSNKGKLELYKEWTGKQYENGAWGDIERVNSILNEDYGLTII